MRVLEISKASAEATRLSEPEFALRYSTLAFVVECVDDSPPRLSVGDRTEIRSVGERSAQALERPFGPDALVCWVLGGRERVTFGRSHASEVVLPRSKISRTHVVVSRTPRGWEIQDDSSTNGTDLNGRTLSSGKPAVLRDGDRIDLGQAVTAQVFLDPTALRRLLHDWAWRPRTPGPPRDRLAEEGPETRRNPRVLASEDDSAAAAEDTQAIRNRVEANFFALFDDLSNYGVIIADPAGRRILFNAAGKRIVGDCHLGADPAEWSRDLGFFLPDGVTPFPAERMPLTLAIAGKRSDDVEVFVRNPQVPKGAWIRVTGQPIRRIRALTGGMMLFHDVTESKRLEEQRRQEQKMEAIGRLAGGVAHDFNNLLTVVNGRAEIARDQLGPHDPLRRDLEEILQVGQRAAQLTRRLLAFSRKQVFQLRVLDLNAVVGEMMLLLRRVVGEDIEIEMKLAPELVSVRADPGQLEQVVLNLAINARDAMPNGGRLTIQTADIAAGQEPELVGRHAALSVSDTGLGMSQEAQAHVFEPFFSTKDVGKGTGLGLSMVFGIVSQSGGRIGVTSELGRGTTFRVLLPGVDADSDDRPRDAPTPPPTGKERILLVEDEDMVRDLARDILEKGGYRVTQARNGEEALRLCGAAPPFDLVVTDVIMPVMGGTALHEELRARRCAIPVLFMSGYTDGLAIVGSTSPQGFIQKPFTPGELCAKVRSALDT